jgi:hypothetical protein
MARSWMNFGGPVNAPDMDILLALPGPRNVEGGLHLHKRVRLHAASLLDP